MKVLSVAYTFNVFLKYLWHIRVIQNDSRQICSNFSRSLLYHKHEWLAVTLREV